MASNRRKMRITTIVLWCLFSFLPPFFLTAQALEPLRSFQDWGVYKMMLNGKKRCYIASTPVRTTGSVKNRSLDPYVSVMHITPQSDEITVSSGYSYKKDHVTLSLDKQKFHLFTKGQIAQAYDREQDRTIVSAMLKATNMRLIGQTVKGAQSEDHYILKGFADAYKSMKTMCKN